MKKYNVLKTFSVIFLVLAILASIFAIVIAIINLVGDAVDSLYIPIINKTIPYNYENCVNGAFLMIGFTLILSAIFTFAAFGADKKAIKESIRKARRPIAEAYVPVVDKKIEKAPKEHIKKEKPVKAKPVKKPKVKKDAEEVEANEVVENKPKTATESKIDDVLKSL